MRAEPSGISSTDSEASIAKGIIVRGDRNSDIAAWFGVNDGRIGDISTGRKFASVTPLQWIADHRQDRI
jgi:hypothetical protein